MYMKPSHRTTRGRWLLLLWTLTCIGGLVALWSVADPRFTPPLLDPGSWTAWWAEREPLDAVAALSRLVASLALAYLALAGFVLLLASSFSAPLATRLAARLNPTPVAGLVTAAAIAAAPSVGASPSRTSDPVADDGPRMALVEDLPTMILLDDGRPDDSNDPDRADMPDESQHSDDTGDAAPEGSAAPSVTVQPLVTVRVEAGDHLWGISERRVSFALGREASDAEVREYWISLIEANSDRLVDPGNPSMLIAGQELVLPG